MTEEDGRRILAEASNRGPVIIWSTHPHGIGDVMPWIRVGLVDDIGQWATVCQPVQIVREATEAEYIARLPAGLLWCNLDGRPIWFYEITAD